MIKLFLICVLSLLSLGISRQRIPAVITFGDSAVDVGNNNYLLTIFKANFPPYGRDFAGHNATGRFCNGKLVTDFMATDVLGLNPAPAYLSPNGDLLNGTNFASAGSGYDDHTSLTTGALSLPVQMAYFKEYQKRLAKVAGRTRAETIINGSLYLSSFGSSDFLQNYYINPLLNTAYTPAQYSDYLLRIFSKYIKELYSMGARRIGVTSLPPLGCFPLARTLFDARESGCVERINNDTRAFNIRANRTVTNLKKELPDIKLVLLDIYWPFYNVIKSPATNGFTEVKRGCCGTGTIETTILLCNPITPGTCTNATKYVFWDSVHPSEAMNQLIFDALLLQGGDLIG